ncbi:MAG TPA: enoyl-CoA hydratase-related protein [Candidatus Baltobacteraceae bacterium]|jgi:methylglutaconyl-CoA hydratase|nr:enoyl-CoA hydratase-related protein [Candidatus Baltobacteraceae bacterium]
MADTPLRIRKEGSVAFVSLHRPDARNALNAELIAELHKTFESLADDTAVRIIVLAGDGPVFCGGADIRWMRDSIELSHERNLADARALSSMLRRIDQAPKPVIASLHGAALGGGAGLAAVCDVAIAAEGTTFGFTETKLGIIPAVISPFVLTKIGTSHLRALALSGERFDARRALAIGLVHEVVPAEELPRALERIIDGFRSAGPSAIAMAKALFARVAQSTYDETLELTAEAIAQQRVSVEGQEGLHAFLEHRPAAWLAL